MVEVPCWLRRSAAEFVGEVERVLWAGRSATAELGAGMQLQPRSSSFNFAGCGSMLSALTSGTVSFRLYCHG